MTKAQLFKEAVAAGKIAADAEPDDFTIENLKALLAETPQAWEPDTPAWEGSLSSDVPIVAADGHVVLSQEEIDARDS